MKDFPSSKLSARPSDSWRGSEGSLRYSLRGTSHGSPEWEFRFLLRLCESSGNTVTSGRDLHGGGINVVPSPGNRRLRSPDFKSVSRTAGPRAERFTPQIEIFSKEKFRLRRLGLRVKRRNRIVNSGGYMPKDVNSNSLCPI